MNEVYVLTITTASEFGLSTQSWVEGIATTHDVAYAALAAWAKDQINGQEDDVDVDALTEEEAVTRYFEMWDEDSFTIDKLTVQENQ